MKKELIILEEALKVIREYSEEIGKCDHSVGLCKCGIDYVGDDLEELIKTKKQNGLP